MFKKIRAHINFHSVLPTPFSSAFDPWVQTILDFIFPAECGYCRQFLGEQRVLIFCQTCWENIPVLPEPYCARCGTPALFPTLCSHFICEACRKHPPFFDRAFSAAAYEGVLKEAIRQFKFGQKLKLGLHLGRLLITCLPDTLPIREYDYILPIPLYKTRRRQRGYNQAAILATTLSQHYSIPLIRHNLIRIRPTDSQALLQERTARLSNVKNAFSVRHPQIFCNKHLILVDDVFTTGSTINECARILKLAGAQRILALTVSRAGLKLHSKVL